MSQGELSRIEGLRMLTLEEIEPGDVIFFRGTTTLSKVIRYFDDSAINHVALATGRGTIIEAIPGGVCIVPLASELATAEWAVVRRWRGAEAPKRRHIVQAAEALRDGAYSYETVILIAVQILLGHRLFAPLCALLARIVTSATRALRRIAGTGASALFCSELVWVAFHRAGCKLYIPQRGSTEGVGNATTPNDIFLERSILEDVGRMEGRCAL